jgi:hypothetical protein
MKRFSFVLMFLFYLTNNVFANPADSTRVEKIKIDFSGFFRLDYWYDSRQVVDYVDGMFLLYPKSPDLDANGFDINAAPNVNLLTMATRLRAGIKMPDLFKAKSLIMIEGDFTGTGNNVSVRLRHAYTKLQWENNSLLFGLTWHPMFVVDVFPTVASLNTGAPFQSFNRSPQVTFQQKLVNELTLTLSAIHQSDSKSMGPNPTPNESSSTYLRNGLAPNLNANIQLVSGSFTIGGSADYKTLRPRLYTTSLINTTEKYKTSERINSLSWMVYSKYQAQKLTIKVKGILGQNLTEHLLLGGYAVRTLDSLTGKETYTPTNHLFVFGNITYGTKFQIGIFTGYAKNLGTTDNFVSNNERFYSRGMDIDYMYRVSPTFSFIKDRFQLSAEVEYTAAAFGTIDNLNNGKILDSKLTENYRFLMVVQYNF